MPTGMENMSAPYGNGNGSGSWDSPYQGGASSSQDRINRDLPSWMIHEGNGVYGHMGMQGDMSRSSSGPIDQNGNSIGHGAPAGLGLGGDEESWRRNGQGWGHDYGRPAALDIGTERDRENVRIHVAVSEIHELTIQLRYNLNDLVESLRPYGASTEFW